MSFRPRRVAENAFIHDAEGGEWFHPLGAFGPAYRVESPALRMRLFNARYTLECAGIVALGFLIFWVAYYDGRDRGMEFAPPLLLLILGPFVYRLFLRSWLKGVPTGPNLRARWREDERPRRPRTPWWEYVLFALYLLAAGWLGELSRGAF